MFQASKGDTGLRKYEHHPDSESMIGLEEWLDAGSNVRLSLVLIGALDQSAALSLNQLQALELSRLLKEFGIRGQLPEPPQPEQNQPHIEESVG